MMAADVVRMAALAAGLEQAPHWPVAVFEAMLDPGALPRRIVLAAEDADAGGGVLAGFAVASLTPPEAELESIAVAEAFQRKGIARRLLGELEARLRSGGVKTIWLEVRASNAGAQGLYRSLGFVESGRRPRYYADPVEDAVLYGREIG